MTETSWSRRRFVATSTATLGSGWLALNWPDITHAAAHAHALTTQSAEQPGKFEHLAPADARDVEALAEQIVPTTETAGARAAGVVFFIDRALGSFFARHAGEFSAGVDAFATLVRERHGSRTRFADLGATTQLEIVRAISDTAFFETMRTLTILGFLASPAYGGNRGEAGWKAVGFTDEHAFEPPFGHYDRDYAGFDPYPTSKASEPT